MSLANDSICLVCLQDDVEMRSIYEPDEQTPTLKIAQKIAQCSELQLQTDDNSFPNQICVSCVNDLAVTWRFRRNCETANSVFRSLQEHEELASVVKVLEERQLRLPKDLKIKRVKSAPKTYLPPETELQIENIASEEVLEEVVKVEVEECELQQTEQPLELAMNEMKQEPAENRLMPLREETNDTKDCNRNNNKLKSKRTKIAKSRCKTKPRKKLTHNQLVCKLCGKLFEYKRNLNSHMQRHKNNRNFLCQFCDKAFLVRSEWRRHMHVKTGHAQCRYCGKAFVSYKWLEQHERSHTGDVGVRSYSCNNCGKSFTFLYMLTEHNCSTQRMKYQCSRCDKGFARKQNLQMHMHLKKHAHTSDIKISQEEEKSLLPNLPIKEEFTTNFIVDELLTEAEIKLEAPDVETEALISSKSE